MKDEPFHITSELSVYITWSPRMQAALWKRYWAVMSDAPEANQESRNEYKQWLQARDAAYQQVLRLFSLTASLPVAGDLLMGMSGEAPIFEELRIETRSLFSATGSEELMVTYEVSSAHIQALEEYREGDFVEDKDE